MRKRTTEIVVEIDELLVVARGAGGKRGWCDACAAEVELLTPAVAATVARMSERAVFRLIETGRLHFNETTAGRLFICLASLDVAGQPQYLPAQLATGKEHNDDSAEKNARHDTAYAGQRLAAAAEGTDESGAAAG